VKNWEIIADNVKKAGWNLGWVSAADSPGRTIFVADAESTESGENNLRVLSGYKQKFREDRADIILIRPHDVWTIYAQLKPSGDYRRTHAVV
jgi:hypothetical protein